MARCYSSLLNRLSGRMERVIYYQVGDRLYARATPGQVKDCRSELQLYYRERMRKTATFYGVIRQTWLARVWQMLGKMERRSGYSLFLQTNMRAFNGEELLYDHGHFSAGNLLLPSGLRGCRAGDKVRLTWKNENVVRGERLRDELWCVVMTEDMRFRIVTPELIGYVRQDEEAEIELTEEQGKRVHLYCFFGAVNKCDFSEDLHILL